MFEAVRNAWALFLGVALISIANGLHGSLLSLRAQYEGFATFEAGAIMSGYFVGYFLGSIVNPKSVFRVGHIRTFGAMASLASMSVLAYIIWIDPSFWFVMRFLTGFAYAGIYIVSESWLNEASDNHTRGKMLSIYMMLIMGGGALGQLFLSLWPAESFELFVVLSVMVSLAVIPILVSVNPAPSFEAPESMTVRKLYKLSPLGVFGMLMIAMTNGVIMALAPVYATSVGMSASELGQFFMVIMLGAMTLQYPIGWVSDRIDRRQMITFLCFASTVIAIFGAVAGAADTRILLLVVFLLGGINFPLYSMALAHTNDNLQKNQMVAAGGTLVFVSGMGMAVGPMGTSYGMEVIGSEFFFFVIGTCNLTVALFALWRMTQRQAVPLEEQSSFSIAAPTPNAQTVASVMLDKGETPEWESDQAPQEEVPDWELDGDKFDDPYATQDDSNAPDQKS